MELEYKVANFLAHNSQILNSTKDMKDAFKKADQLPQLDAIDMILDTLLLVVAEHSSFTPLELTEAFEDDKVKIVLHTYYLKGYQYEH